MRIARLSNLPSFVGVAILALACGGTDAPPATGPSADCADVEVIVATSDSKFTSSRLCGLPGQCASGSDLGTSPVLTRGEDRVFYLSYPDDVLFELDPSCGTLGKRVSLTPVARTDARGTRQLANAHDAAAAPDGTIVVPLYDSAAVAFVKDGKVDPVTIDLSGYDNDGNPQADAVAVVEVAGASKAFVTLERLDDGGYLRSTKPSQMLRVDVATRTVEAVIDLEGRNPFNRMAELDGVLFLGEAGNFDTADDDDAGIERFDTATSTSRLLVRERDLGGSVAEVAITRGCGAAIVAGADEANRTSVVTFDPATGAIVMGARSPALGPTEGYDLQGLAWQGDTLYVGDRRPLATGFAVRVLQRTEGCTVVDTGRTIHAPQRPVTLRPARTPRSVATPR